MQHFAGNGSRSDSGSAAGNIDSSFSIVPYVAYFTRVFKYSVSRHFLPCFFFLEQAHSRLKLFKAVSCLSKNTKHQNRWTAVYTLLHMLLRNARPFTYICWSLRMLSSTLSTVSRRPFGPACDPCSRACSPNDMTNQYDPLSIFRSLSLTSSTRPS